MKADARDRKPSSVPPDSHHANMTRHRLVSEDAANCQNIGLPKTSCPPGSLYTRTLSYDADGNVEHVTLVWGGNTYVVDYGWEPGTHHLLSVTRNGTLSATFEYDRLDRIRKFCWNSPMRSGCHLFSYVGDSDWLSVVRNEYGAIVLDRTEPAREYAC